MPIDKNHDLDVSRKKYAPIVEIWVSFEKPSLL